jgi:ABC-2 type transport system permease protein
MVFRMTKTSVPVIDVVISLALLMVSIYLVVRGAARILRAGSLMYGKRFTLPEVARWLREA